MIKQEPFTLGKALFLNQLKAILLTIPPVIILNFIALSEMIERLDWLPG
jgi:hypothetical protein